MKFYDNFCKKQQQLLKITTVAVVFYKESMIARSIKPLLYKALSRSPVVLLNGVRQVCKTTLTLEMREEKGYHYVTFDDEMLCLRYLFLFYGINEA